MEILQAGMARLADAHRIRHDAPASFTHCLSAVIQQVGRADVFDSLEESPLKRCFARICVAFAVGDPEALARIVEHELAAHAQLMNSKSAAVDNSKRRKTPAPVTPGVADGNISGFRHAADSSPDLELERRLRETEKEFNEVLRRSAELEKGITQGVPPPEVPQLLARLATLIAALDKLQAERVDAIVPQTGRHSEGVSETARKRRRSMNATLQERRAWLEQALDAARAYAKAGAAV
eukprot:TRINITY_DN6410_c0_g1_i1.p1 TRINITY_DN6410_c0_g1~~TRINITY_DN6410_c0_g1_i1.p1  ORF type:complete len:237 (-),score=53.15 TRINITY_DN6410_c0_g1_i1:686-1396(-)